MRAPARRAARERESRRSAAVGDRHVSELRRELTRAGATLGGSSEGEPDGFASPVAVLPVSLVALVVDETVGELTRGETRTLFECDREMAARPSFIQTA
jgi:hypothetical protein